MLSHILQCWRIFLERVLIKVILSITDFINIQLRVIIRQISGILMVMNSPVNGNHTEIKDAGGAVEHVGAEPNVA